MKSFVFFLFRTDLDVLLFTQREQALVDVINQSTSMLMSKPLNATKKKLKQKYHILKYMILSSEFYTNINQMIH